MGNSKSVSGTRFYYKNTDASKSNKFQAVPIQLDVQSYEQKYNKKHLFVFIMHFYGFIYWGE